MCYNNKLYKTDDVWSKLKQDSDFGHECSVGYKNKGTGKICPKDQLTTFEKGKIPSKISVPTIERKKKSFQLHQLPSIAEGGKFNL